MEPAVERRELGDLCRWTLAHASSSGLYYDYNDYTVLVYIYTILYYTMLYYTILYCNTT